MIQRFIMLGSYKKVKAMLLNSIGFYFIFRLMLMIIGMGSIVLYSNINVGKSLEKFLITNLFDLKLQGVILSGIIAIIMSTADSFLNAAGIVIVNDIINPIFNKKTFNQITLIRYVTFAIGVLSILMAIFSLHTHQMLFYSRTILSMVLAPFILSIMGLKRDKKIIYISILGHFAGILLSIKIFNSNFNFYKSNFRNLITCLGILANILTFITYYLLKYNFLKASSLNSKSFLKAFYNFKGLIPNPKSWGYNLINYSIDKVNRYGANSTSFALFLCMYYMTPFFMESYGNQEYYIYLILIRGIGVSLCIILLLKEYWPYKLKIYFPTYWHATLLYCIPFTTTVLFLMESFSSKWLINVGIAIMLLISLVDWITFFILYLSGALLGTIFYKKFIGLIPKIDMDTTYNFIFGVFFAIINGFVFVRKKEKQFNEYVLKSEYLEELCKNMNNELIKVITKQEGIRENLGNYYMEYIDDISGIERIEKEFNNATKKIFRTAKSKLKKRLADRMIYHRYN